MQAAAANAANAANEDLAIEQKIRERRKTYADAPQVGQVALESEIG